MFKKAIPAISVLMPTYNQGAFIARAIKSLQLQTFTAWELIIINDGSTDYTYDVIEPFIDDSRIHYHYNDKNEGLGYSLNKGLKIAKADLIAYLPSDDIIFSDHLETLYKNISEDNHFDISVAGITHNYNDNIIHSGSSNSIRVVDGGSFQLVQVLHKKNNEKWLERDELVTDSLNIMFWSRLIKTDNCNFTDKITCEWVNHTEQRHKIITETNGGGIYLYKQYYNVKKAIKFHSSVGNFIDEKKQYESFVDKPRKSGDVNSLKILLVGELAYNPERILALEERGHKLYGLWMTSPNCYNTVGPLAFGNIEDIPLDNWVSRVNEIKPDIIYALLNYQAVSFAHQVMVTVPEIPFVWHFKEGPFMCRQYGTWKELFELYTNSDGQIYTNIEVMNWFHQFLNLNTHSFLLDGDLPKTDYFKTQKTKLKSESDGHIHTVLPGRPFGISPSSISQLAKHKIHFHFYGDFQQSFWGGWIRSAQEVAPDFFHIHPNCPPMEWTSELSQYDAGWLHIFKSTNSGELMKASWSDLNYPARMTTLAAAGLPMIQMNNKGHISATYSLIQDNNMGVDFVDFEELATKLYDKKIMEQIRDNVWNNRLKFSFDYHVDDLIDFFVQVIKKKKSSKDLN